MKFKLIGLTGLLLVTYISCNKQTKKYDYIKETTYIMDTTIINNDSFDWEEFNAKAKGKTTYDETLDDSTYIYISVSDDYHTYRLTPPDSYYSTLKCYYASTGTIESEGLLFTKGRWRTGLWKFYDTSGRLEKTIDYDKPFKFTFEEVLRYCEKQGWKIEKGYFGNADVGIRRQVFEGKGIWIIKAPFEDITLDGNTGREISRTEALYQ